MLFEITYFSHKIFFIPKEFSLKLIHIWFCKTALSQCQKSHHVRFGIFIGCVETEELPLGYFLTISHFV